MESHQSFQCTGKKRLKSIAICNQTYKITVHRRLYIGKLKKREIISVTVTNIASSSLFFLKKTTPILQYKHERAMSELGRRYKEITFNQRQSILWKFFVFLVCMSLLYILSAFSPRALSHFLLNPDARFSKRIDGSF